MPVNATFIEELELFTAADVIKARRATPGHAPGNKSDPDSYSTSKTCKAFVDRMFGGKDSGGDTESNSVVRNKSYVFERVEVWLWHPGILVN